jgi:hypothetical protein
VRSKATAVHVCTGSPLPVQVVPPHVLPAVRHIAGAATNLQYKPHQGYMCAHCELWSAAITCGLRVLHRSLRLLQCATRRCELQLAVCPHKVY